MEKINLNIEKELLAYKALSEALIAIFARDGCKWPECTNNDTLPCWYRNQYEDC